MPVCVRCFRVQPSAEITFRRAHGAPTCKDVSACKRFVGGDQAVSDGHGAAGTARNGDACPSSGAVRALPPAFACTPSDIDESGGVA